MSDTTVEFLVCDDCAIVIVNDDSSGIADAERHRARMEIGLSSVRDVIVSGEADIGWVMEWCGACEQFLFTNSWYRATAEAG